MGHRVVVGRSFGELNRADWLEVCSDPTDLLMSLPFLQAVEQTMSDRPTTDSADWAAAELWYLLAYDGDRPVGAACVAEYPLDAVVFSHPLFARFVRAIRWLFPRYLKFRITFCGLPVSTAGSNLRVAADVESAPVVARLRQAIEHIARQRKTWLVVFKELDAQEDRQWGRHLASDYVRADSLPMNRIENHYANFDTMLQAMRSHYRYKITKSRKKFAASGLSLNRMRGPQAIAAAYTPAMHSLYESVTGQAEHRLELLPRNFFLRLAEAFPSGLLLTTIQQDDATVAFAWSLRTGNVYRNLFVGIDYDANEQTDAYFNLMIEDIAYAMSQPVDEILVGQTADEFKSRLGCTSDARYLYIRVLPRWLRWCFLRAQAWILAAPANPPAREVFKSEQSDAALTAAAK